MMKFDPLIFPQLFFLAWSQFGSAEVLTVLPLKVLKDPRDMAMAFVQ